MKISMVLKVGRAKGNRRSPDRPGPKRKGTAACTLLPMRCFCCCRRLRREKGDDIDEDATRQVRQTDTLTQAHTDR